MFNDTVLALAILKLGLLWALGISFLTLVLTALLAPQMFGDGQYGMIFLVTFPLGWTIGASVAIVKSKKKSDVSRSRKSDALAAATIGAGCLILPFGGLIFMMLVFAFVGIVLRAFGG